jgi:hypothetical protein
LVRQLATGARPEEIEQQLDAAMGHPRLREVLHCMMLLAYGALLRDRNGCTPVVDEFIGRELRMAQDLAELATYIPEIEANTEPIATPCDTAKVGWLVRMWRRLV